MIIHQPAIEEHGDEISLSAQIEFEKPVENIPPTLWFRFPSTCRDAITDRSDAFLAGLLTTGMALGEPIQVRGVVSPRLLYGLKEYQQAALCWYPQRFRHISIACETISAMEEDEVQEAVGMAYSGGVDSAYTLYSHLPENQPLPGYQVTHALFLHGFDIPLHAEEDFQLARQSLQETLQPLGVEIIPCRTNLHAFTEGRIPWMHAFGPVLLSAALTLGKLFKRFIVPPSVSYRSLKPWGASPITDPLFSTETLDIVHFGAGKEKMERIATIAAWKPAQDSLRVCVDEHRRRGVQNCCRCKKCIMTLTLLSIIGDPSDFKTFDKPFSLFDILRWAPHYLPQTGLSSEIIRHAWKNRKVAIIPFMLIVSLVGTIRYLLIRLMPKKLFLRLKRHFYPIEKNAFAYINLPEEDA